MVDGRTLGTTSRHLTSFTCIYMTLGEDQLNESNESNFYTQIHKLQIAKSGVIKQFRD